MNIDNIFSTFFPLGYQQRRPYHFSTIQTIDYHFRFFKYQLSVVVGDYFPNRVASTKILVAMAPKVVAAWRVVSGKFYKIS